MSEITHDDDAPTAAEREWDAEQAREIEAMAALERENPDD